MYIAIATSTRPDTPPTSYEHERAAFRADHDAALAKAKAARARARVEWTLRFCRVVTGRGRAALRPARRVT